MIHPTTLHATKPAVAPGPIAMTSPDARDAHESFDQLRVAIEEEDDVNLFELLQAALVDLVVVGRSFEVHTRCLTQRMMRLNIKFQSNHKTKHGFTVLENRLPDFEVVATASKSYVPTAADDEDLQRLLHATGV